MPTTRLVHMSAAEEIARAARSRGLPRDTTLEQLLAHERSTGAVLAVSEAFEDLARWRRGARSDQVASGLRRALARVAEAVRPVLDWFGLV